MSTEWILGLNGMNLHTHDAAACLLRDGELVAASAEERFTGVKHTAEFPLKAIRWCLEDAGIQIEDLTAVAYPFSPKLRLREGIRYFLANLPSSLRLISPHPFLDLLQKRSIGSQLTARLGVERNRLRARVNHVPHHLAHAASAFYGSPFFEAAILTMDGIGEMDSGMIAAGIGHGIHPLLTLSFPDSIGLLYRAVTVHLGFCRDGDEGKVMGLSSWGDDRFVKDFEDFYELTETGFRINRHWFNTLYYPTEGGVIDFVTPAFHNRFGPPRPATDEITDHHMALARALQTATEKIVFHLGGLALARTGFSHLCLAGGVALNSCANGKLLQLPGLKEIYIQPGAADDGSAIGAALQTHVERNQKRPKLARLPMHGLNAASTVDDSLLKRLNFRVSRPDNLADVVAEHLAAGKFIGICRGRAEFGPRALGHRSILADPRVAAHKTRLNDEIKKREWFRPFAPLVPLEDADRYFEDCRESPHMLLVFPVKREFRDKLPAITHIDCSARVQTLRQDDDPFLYELLRSFERLTGMPVLLNTSFNGPGKPLVNTAQDALRTFVDTGLDLLVLEDRLIEKKDSGNDQHYPVFPSSLS